MDRDAMNFAYTPTTGVRQAHETPVIAATDEALAGYGRLVDDPAACEIEIVPWPAQGWRPIDPNSGDQGGVTEGVFEFWWKGDTLYARNNAVGDDYLFGWSRWPEEAAADGPPAPRRDRFLNWRANYHPDGGQLFFPLHGESYLVALALPGDDVRPESFVTFRCEGRGLYIHPNVWHGAVVPLDDHAQFLDRQGRVHARVSVDFAKEFGGYLAMPLT